MQFEIHTEQLIAAVSTAVRFVERRPNLPVLTSILLTAEGNRITLRATNLECGVEVVVPAKVSEPGVVAIPGATLYGFIGNTKGKSVSLRLQGQVVTLETERAVATIKTIPHEDFPVLPRVSADHVFSVKSPDLAKAIKSVAHCASVSTVKPELQSVLWYGDAGKLQIVATDSFRLAEKTIPLKSAGSVPFTLLPARNATELVKLLESVRGDVDVYYNENQISIQLDHTYYTSRLLDGTFPNYRQIVPSTFLTEAVVLKEDILTAIKSLTVFSDKFSQILLSVDPQKKQVLLTSRNPDVGEQTSTIRATISGEAVSLSFNSRYLSDGFQAISGDSVRLGMNGVGKALFIKDASDDSFFYLAMPMNR